MLRAPQARPAFAEVSVRVGRFLRWADLGWALSRNPFGIRTDGFTENSEPRGLSGPRSGRRDPALKRRAIFAVFLRDRGM